MVPNQNINKLFNYGDTVEVKLNAPTQFYPKAIGSISGIRQIKTEATASHFQQPPKSYLYLVELNDGNAIEIPEIYLIKLDE